MIPVQIILIAIGALLADADECSCECNKKDVCEEQNFLRSEQEANTAELEKWNRHYNFVRGFAKDWHNQIAHVVRQQLEVLMNESAIVFKQNEDLIARTGSLETSFRELHERAEEMDVTMEMLSSEISGVRTELLRTQHGTKCGVDFDIGESNGGGSNSSNLVWPWIAAVYRNDTAYYDYICGGSIIHRYFVLTSAYCLYAYGRDGLSVNLGLSDLKKKNHLQKYRVRSVHIHPQYKNEPYNNLDFNIALLELEEPILFGPFVRPICLTPPREIPQEDLFYKPQSAARAVYVEYYMETPRTASPTPLNLTILPQEECRRKLEENSYETNSYTSPEFSFCVESPSKRCPYIGSPLMQTRLADDGTRTWTQVGIRIWEKGCKYFYSTRLDHLRTWVDATIAAVSPNL